MNTREKSEIIIADIIREARREGFEFCVEQVMSIAVAYTTHQPAREWQKRAGNTIRQRLFDAREKLKVMP